MHSIIWRVGAAPIRGRTEGFQTLRPPTAVHAFDFNARRMQHSLPSKCTHELFDSACHKYQRIGRAKKKNHAQIIRPPFTLRGRTTSTKRKMRQKLRVGCTYRCYDRDGHENADGIVVLLDEKAQHRRPQQKQDERVFELFQVSLVERVLS